MYYVVLADGTRIDNCSGSTTSNYICAIRDNYADAGAVRDLITPENAAVIRVYRVDSDKEGSEPVEITVGADLVLIPGADLVEVMDKVECRITTRVKTDVEKLQDEVSELQDVVIGD